MQNLLGSARNAYSLLMTFLQYIILTLINGMIIFYNKYNNTPVLTQVLLLARRVMWGGQAHVVTARDVRCDWSRLVT